MSDMTRQRIVLETPEMELVEVERELAYHESDGKLLGLDIYRPPGTGTTRAALLFVTGYGDPGFKTMLGCRMKDMGSYDSWARLVAASGIIGITYENRDPVSDARAALEYVAKHAGELGIDRDRIGIWSCSGNVPNALGLLCTHGAGIACATLCYGYTCDAPGDRTVQDAAQQFRFSHAPATTSIDRLPDLPMLLVRAGQDETPSLNLSIDRFVSAALGHNLNLTLLNYPEGHHAFDLNDNNDATRTVIRRILAFNQRFLGPGNGERSARVDQEPKR